MSLYLANDMGGVVLFDHKPVLDSDIDLWVAQSDGRQFELCGAFLQGIPMCGPSSCIEVELVPVGRDRPHFWFVSHHPRGFAFREQPRNDNGVWIAQLESDSDADYIYRYGVSCPAWVVGKGDVARFGHDPVPAAFVECLWSTF